ncbi:MAG: histone deacetylase [Acidobacteria bacterium]|nr:MAG: histone deacetylase [Acidobacteriota bacterium]
MRDQRRHPAPGGHVVIQVHRRDQQGRRRPHLQGGQLRRRRRPVRVAAEADRGREELLRGKAVTRVLLYDDPVFREHDAGRGHPERPERLDAVRRGLREAALEPKLQILGPRDATAAELRRVHTEAHVARVAATAGRTVRFDPDTQAGARTYPAALKAAGAVVDAVERVLGREADRVFCAVRPPGHHAEADRAMGFCYFNNVAVGAAHALARGLERVMVVDWDVHHGNGTQHSFYDDPRVLYLSSHEFPFYPGTGALDEVGEGAGRGFTVNLPMPAGMGDTEYARVYRQVVEPIGRAFDPQVLLVSVGFDPHVSDPLAGMRVTERGFAELADACLSIAAGAAGSRAVFVLEGGYDLEGIARSSAAVVGLLAGGTHEPLAWPASGPIDRLVEAYRKQLAPYWPVLRS